MSQSKRCLQLKLGNIDDRPTGIFKYSEVVNILDYVAGNKELNKVSLNDAIYIIIKNMYESESTGFYIDISTLNEKFAPVPIKQMTKEEIEEELGYKISIISKNEEEMNILVKESNRIQCKNNSSETTLN